MSGYVPDEWLSTRWVVMYPRATLSFSILSYIVGAIGQRTDGEQRLQRKGTNIHDVVN